MKQLYWIILASALSAAPANADWQFTKWGMTKDQVIKASKGKAIAGDAADLDGHSYTDHSAVAQLKMPYTSGPLTFTAYFLFSPDGQLVVVDLDAGGGPNAQAPFDAVSGKYGEPAKTTGSSVSTTRIWFTKSEEIQADLTGMPNQPPTMVNVTYKGRKRKGDEGL